MIKYKIVFIKVWILVGGYSSKRTQQSKWKLQFKKEKKKNSLWDRKLYIMMFKLFVEHFRIINNPLIQIIMIMHVNCMTYNILFPLHTRVIFILLLSHQLLTECPQGRAKDKTLYLNLLFFLTKPDLMILNSKMNLSNETHIERYPFSWFSQYFH